MRGATAPGISRALARLFRYAGQVAYALLTHSPLGSHRCVLARLACIRHSTSVRSEPGSNSSCFQIVCPARFPSSVISLTGASLKHISKSFNKPARLSSGGPAVFPTGTTPIIEILKFPSRGHRHFSPISPLVFRLQRIKTRISDAVNTL